LLSWFRTIASGGISRHRIEPKIEPDLPKEAKILLTK
jgi:hypothetical protein